MLKAIGLAKDYKGPNGPLHVLRGVDLEIIRGELVFIVGRSGTGKSTLLHLLGGLDRPTKGSVEFEGDDISTLGEAALARYRNQKVGFVFQFYHLLPELTVEENVVLPSWIRGKRDSRRADTLLKEVGLWQRRGHLPSELSGGEQQRVAIARSLVNEPDIVFCDEPTGNLDEETANTVHELIFKLNERGQTFCIVTHEESFAQKSDRVYRLHEGLVQNISKVGGISP
ncbi:MAG: hypothetical protein A3G87_07600 [Omnitrophica bacterium RIFCSPLOWO2_12_FULL_50_11]|nr:MAG: hypothetical protein A3G87_07600 [Omnitrophica bacterium RIFCSPLOWO2_12_FULL_50_11]